MRTMPAREAKQSFGKLLDDAQHEPVRIERNGREVAVVLSSNEYKRLAAYKEFVRTRIAKEDIAAAEQVHRSLKDDERREAEADLEALLLEGLNSGPATPLSAEDWAAVDHNLEEHLAKHAGRETA